jgi:hypothetical protein
MGMPISFTGGEARQRVWPIRTVVVQRAVYDMGTGTQSAMHVVAMHGL